MAQRCFFPLQNQLELGLLHKQLKTYGCQKNIKNEAKAPVV